MMNRVLLVVLSLGFAAQANAEGPNWQDLADRCFASAAANFKIVSTNPAALDAFRQQAPEYAAKLLGFGAEVATQDISITKVLASYSVGTPTIHPDLYETVAPIDVVLLLSIKGPGKVTSTLYTERVWARDVALTYNCYYDENFRMGALQQLPYGIETFQNLFPGLKDL